MMPQTDTAQQPEAIVQTQQTQHQPLQDPQRSSRRAALVRAVRELAEQHGPNLTRLQFCRAQGISRSKILRDFDSWKDLREAAGLAREVDHSAAAVVHTRQSLLEALQQAVEAAGPEISLSEFSHRTGISLHPIERVFGSWRQFRTAAGLEPQPRRSRQKLDREGVKHNLWLITRSRPYITQYEFCVMFDVTPATLNRLGPWTALRDELNLDLRGSRRKDYWYNQHKDLLPPLEVEEKMRAEMKDFERRLAAKNGGQASAVSGQS
jgi:hypothetical protein